MWFRQLRCIQADRTRRDKSSNTALQQGRRSRNSYWTSTKSRKCTQKCCGDGMNIIQLDSKLGQTSSPKLGRQNLTSDEAITNSKLTTSDPSGELSESIQIVPNFDPLLLCVSEIKSGTASLGYFEDTSLVFDKSFFEASLSQSNPNASKPILKDLEASSALQVNPSNGIRQNWEREQSGSRSHMAQPLENYHLEIHRTEEPPKLSSIKSDQSLVGTRLVDEEFLRQSRGTLIPNGSTTYTTNLQNTTSSECHTQSRPDLAHGGALPKQNKPYSIRSATILSNTKRENELVSPGYLNKTNDLEKTNPPYEELTSFKVRDHRFADANQQQGQLNTYIIRGRDSPVTIEMTHIVSLRCVKQGDGNTVYVKDTQPRNCQCSCACLNSQSAVREVENQPVRLPSLPLVNEACQTSQQMGYLIDSRFQKTYLDQQRSSLDFQSVDSRLAAEPVEEPVKKTVKCCTASRSYSEPNQDNEPKDISNRQYHTNPVLKPQQQTSQEGSSESVICPTCCPKKTERKTQQRSSVLATETSRYKSDITAVELRQDLMDPLGRPDDMADVEEPVAQRSTKELGRYDYSNKTPSAYELRPSSEEERVCSVDCATPKAGYLVEPAAITVEEKSTRLEATDESSVVEGKDETSNPCYFCFRRRRKSKLPEPVPTEIERWSGNPENSQVDLYGYGEESTQNTLDSALRLIQHPSNPVESAASLQISRLVHDPNLHSIHDERVAEGGYVKTTTISPTAGVSYVKLVDPVKSYRAVAHSMLGPTSEPAPSEFVNTSPEYNYLKKEVEYRKPYHLPPSTVVEQTVQKNSSPVRSISNLTSEPNPLLHPWHCCHMNKLMKPIDRNYFARPVDPVTTPAKELCIVESQHMEAAEYPWSTCCPCPHERPLSFIHMQHVWPNCLTNLPGVCRCKRIMNECCSCSQIRWTCDNPTHQGAQMHYYGKSECSQEGGLCDCRKGFLACPLA